MSTLEHGAVYVYCFTRPGALGALSVPGVSGATDVETLELGGVAAVFSPLCMEEFLGPEGDEHAQDLEWVAPRALRHEAVVEEVMRFSPALPVSFGAVFSSPRALSEAVRSHERRITEFLDDIANKEEWAVKIYVHRQRLRADLERQPEFLQRQGPLPASEGARYLYEKRLHRALDERARGEGGRIAARIRDELSQLAVAERSLRLAERDVTGRQDDMVSNCAFLARSGEVEAFLRRVGQLSEEYEPRGVTVEATGPWPPYSFCPSLEVPP
ncbi:MAG: GvpL/GvpF family gas vesicle protein [Myxococcaceae bacterium]